jgi:Phage integrase family
VTLSAENAKNGRMAVQPLPDEVAESLRKWLADKPAARPLWPGTWYKKAAEILRADLEAATAALRRADPRAEGIPYVVEGPNGPQFADFHALRHSYIAMLDKSGASLREAMQLARHSDPRLTMAVYGRAQLHDLGAAVGRLPDLFNGGSEPQSLRATGTDSALSGGSENDDVRCTRVAQKNDNARDALRLADSPTAAGVENETGRKPLQIKAFEASCDALTASETG